MARPLETWAYGVLSKYQGKMEQMFGMDLPYDVKFVQLSHADYTEQYVGEGGDPRKQPTAHWSYDTRTIYIDQSKASRNDPGFIVHELTHAFQGASQVPSKKTEALADYARWKLDLTHDGWTLSPEAARFADMTPGEIRNVMARQTSEATPRGDGGPRGGEGSEKPLAERIEAMAKRLINGTDSAYLGDANRKDLTYTLFKAAEGMLADGSSEDEIIRRLHRLEFARGGSLTITEQDGSTSRFTLLNAPDNFSLKVPEDGEGGGGGGSDTLTGEDILANLGASGGSEAPSKREYLGSVFDAGVPITREVRQLVKEATDGEWSIAEFQFELSKTDTYQKDAQVSYQAILQSYGMEGDNLNGLMRKAVESGYSGEEFLYFLRQTPEYRQRFKGIFYKDGRMRMSEEEYLTFESDLTQLGKEYGYKVDAQDVGESLRKGIMPEQFEDRLGALQRIREYEPAMKQFQATLRARGLLPKGSRDWTKAEMYEFVTGQSNPQFYKVWEEASARTAAVNAGIHIIGKKGEADGYTDIRRGALMQIIKSLPGRQTEEDLAEGFAQLGEDLLEVLPLSEARTYGLTKRDLITATFGGRNAAKARQKVKRVIATHEAFQEDRAAEGFGATADGRLGTPTSRQVGGQQSEY